MSRVYVLLEPRLSKERAILRNSCQPGVIFILECCLNDVRRDTSSFNSIKFTPSQSHATTIREEVTDCKNMSVVEAQTG